jgi:hypothetical protein
VCPRTGLGEVESIKISPQTGTWGSDPSVVHPVASRYTESANPNIWTCLMVSKVRSSSLAVFLWVP